MMHHSLRILLLAATLLFTQCSFFGKSGPEEEPREKTKAPSVEQAAKDETIGVEQGSTDDTAWQSGQMTDKMIYNLDQQRKKTPPSSTQSSFVSEELNYEVKRLAAELKHVQKKLAELQTQSEVWTNPLSIYSKEIHLENGTKIFGDVVDQDKNNIQIKTLIGQLTIARGQIVRIVDNIPTDPEGPKGGIKTPSSAGGDAPMNMAGRQGPMTTTKDVSGDQVRTDKYTANVVLSGNIKERKDRSGNTILSGVVKNIGGRRADFVKVNFLFRINWSGDTRELTAFAKGSHHVFSSGVSTDTSLLPGASGEFELYIPKSFGAFIGYSYSIDWEEHDI